MLVALPAGVLVDRWPPRRVVAVAHAFRAVVTALLALAVYTDRAGVALLCGCAFLLTAAETFADTASQVLLVELAGPAELEQANGRFVTVETVGMDLVGPLAASALFWWQPAACFALDALTFVVAAYFVFRLPEVAPDRPPRTNLRAQLAEGAGFLFRSPELRVLVVAVGVTAVCASAVNAMFALYAVTELGLPPSAVPWLVVVLSLGALAGARTSPALAARFGVGPVMVGALVLLGAAFALYGAVPLVSVGVVAVLLFGVASAGWNVLSATRRQRLTPVPLMGRVSSAYRVLTWGLSPVGAAVAGPLAVSTSLGAVYLVAGAATVITATVLARPLMRT